MPRINPLAFATLPALTCAAAALWILRPDMPAREAPWAVEILAVCLAACLGSNLLAVSLWARQRRQVHSAEQYIRAWEQGDINHTELPQNLPVLRLLQVATAREIASVRQDGQAALAELTGSIAHAMKSPIAALSGLQQTEWPISHGIRDMAQAAVQRLQAISCDMLLSHPPSPPPVRLKPEVQHVASLKTSLVSAALQAAMRAVGKRQQAPPIQLTQDMASYGLFVQAGAAAVRDLLRRLLEQASVVTPANKTMQIHHFASTTEVYIIVEIPETTAAGHLSKWQRAQRGAQMCGGRLHIEMDNSASTCVTLVLPRAQMPQWFMSKLELTSSTTCVVVDDDTQMHRLWESRLAGLTTVHLGSAGDLQAWHSKHDGPEVCYIVDYEFPNSMETGLTLARRLKIVDRSAFIAPDIDEPSIFLQCVVAGARVIPKDLVAHVPLVVKTQAA